MSFQTCRKCIKRVLVVIGQNLLPDATYYLLDDQLFSERLKRARPLINWEVTGIVLEGHRH